RTVVACVRRMRTGPASPVAGGAGPVLWSHPRWGVSVWCLSGADRAGDHGPGLLEVVLPVAPRVRAVGREVEVGRDSELAEAAGEVGGAVLGGGLDHAADDGLVGQGRDAVVQALVGEGLVRSGQAVAGGDEHGGQGAVVALLLEAPGAPHRVIVEPAVGPVLGNARERAPHVLQVGAAAHAGDDVDELVA